VHRRSRVPELIGLLAVLLAWMFAQRLGAQTAPPSRLLLDSMSAPVFSRVPMRCREIGIQEFYSIGVITGCMGKNGDTLFIAYKTRDGAPLAMTKQFFVRPSRLRAVGDSIRVVLSQEFGPAQHCPRTTWTADRWDSWQWHLDSLTIQLAVNDQEEPPKFNNREYPWVGVQFVEAKIRCGDWLPEAQPVD